MSSDFPTLGLIDPDDREKSSSAKEDKVVRRPSGAPPFRRSRSGPPPGGGARRSSPAPASTSRLFTGLSRGGTIDDLSGVSVRRRAAVAAGSAAFHLLLLLLFVGGLVPVAPQPVAAEPEEEPLLYAFEAPPLEELQPEPPPVEALAEPLPPVPPPEEMIPEAPEAQAAPPPPPPASGIVVPEAQIAVPSTGFQNDLPFSEGQDEEFYIDHEMGDELSAEDDSSAGVDEPEPEVVAEIPAFEEPADAPGEPTPELPGTGAEDPALSFDAEAFRRLINDPAADVRRLSDELAMREARAQAEAERRKAGAPTDIWRFLEGKRFRNPEGGLVSNRNNTLYYDDRGANLVPWISRLIAEVRRNWYIPYAASYDHGHVAIAISVLRSGDLAWLQVVVPSGVPGFDNAAVGALRGAQLLPLPDDYPGAEFEIMLVFWYNEQPYDLFSTQD